MTEKATIPPPTAEWLLGLVATPDQLPAILGDLREEFSTIHSRAGMAPARRWYWSHTARTIMHLLASQVRRAPAETIGFAIGGFALYILAVRALQVSAEGLGSHTRMYFYVSAVPFWSIITFIERYVLPIVVGWTVARAARGREIITALSVGTIVTTWIVAFYGAWLLANAQVAEIHIPDFSIQVSMFTPFHSPRPHAGGFSNTLTHLRLALIYWLIPMNVALLIGAAIRRVTSSGQILRREIAH